MIFRLHGELLLGLGGSMLVELAASWAIVMLISGLYLWWPRDASGIAGIVYPRLRRGGRVFWRDLHAVVGLRSEEHTSELQSLMRISYAVFCLKKKKKNNRHVNKTNNVPHAGRYRQRKR